MHPAGYPVQRPPDVHCPLEITFEMGGHLGSNQVASILSEGCI